MGVFDLKDKVIEKAILNIGKENLGLRKNERLLVLSDWHKTKIGEWLFNGLKNMVKEALHFSYKPTIRHGIEPPETVWMAAFGASAVQALKEEGLFKKILDKEIGKLEEERIFSILKGEVANAPDVVLAVNRFSISHTFFRKLCTDIFGIRFVSMPLFEPFMFYTSMQADWEKVEERSLKIAQILTEGEKVCVVSSDGTNISFDISSRKGVADTGRFLSPGCFGNLPAGEAFIAPVEEKAEGVFATHWAPDRRLKEPVKFFVKKGKVVNISGEKEFCSYMERVFMEDERHRNVAELGIGTNDKAVRFDNILEGEKILGTCHIAVGDNSAFGGRVRAKVHIDFIVEKPTLIVYRGNEKVKIIKEGKLVV
ncbi:aminopeptidase [Desulfurobacterium atlanticum]|uniref:Leucyl aminopeptidase (Aminopeptidase T) n=1 Tax=Desulfurobacterium atlanticum TaxID=240169 RepID=A0A239AE05_9BACT|nr:aminopeptidase [Desulfurobacterium atlanticum]SNR93274.1 Leucyl aminopeptidase (aminopeptidase T) [Desulfurobacterium atlanticum]